MNDDYLGMGSSQELVRTYYRERVDSCEPAVLHVHLLERALDLETFGDDLDTLTTMDNRARGLYAVMRIGEN